MIIMVSSFKTDKKEYNDMKKILLAVLLAACAGMRAQNCTTTFVVNKQVSWSSMYVYAWGAAGNDLLGAWPGKNISNLTTFTITGPYEGQIENLIFNNNSSQLPDVAVVLTDTTYYLTVTNDGVTGVDPIEYEETDFYIVGDYNEWTPEEAVAFEYADGVYTLTMDTLWGGFKIISSRDWLHADYGAAVTGDTIGVGETYALKSNQGSANFDVNLIGTYVDVTMKLRIYEDGAHMLTFVSGTQTHNTYYLTGNFIGYDPSLIVEMEYGEDGIYRAHLDSFYGGIRVLTRHSWVNNYGAVQANDTIGVGETYTLTQVTDWNLNTWHRYTDADFTLAFEDGEARFTFVSGTREPLEGRDFWVGNGAFEAYKFAYEDGVYTVTLDVVEDSLFLVTPYTYGDLSSFNIGYGAATKGDRIGVGGSYRMQPGTDGKTIQLYIGGTYYNATFTMVLDNDIPLLTFVSGRNANDKEVITAADHGTVTQGGVYPVGTVIELEATPDEGFAFNMWSDGETANPRTLTVTQDTLIRALFYMPEVEQEVSTDSITTNSVVITWTAVEDAVLYELNIYLHGRLVAQYHIDAENNIVDSQLFGPQRIVARRDSTGGSSETLQVNVGGLEPGQDYSYSLDAMDDDRNYVGSQSGTFTTEEEETGLDVLFDDRRPVSRKILRDGRLYIELPDGTVFDARGIKSDIGR